MIQVRAAETAADLAAARALFEAYAAAHAADPEFAQCVDRERFAREVAELPGVYAPPAGVLLVAWADGMAAGCVACRPVEAHGTCEMKRLYVAPAFRGRGAGETLVRALLRDAARIGYVRLRLDTLPSMRAAQALYERLGFRDIPAYVDDPVPGTRFMAIELAGPTGA